MMLSTHCSNYQGGGNSAKCLNHKLSFYMFMITSNISGDIRLTFCELQEMT